MPEINLPTKELQDAINTKINTVSTDITSVKSKIDSTFSTTSSMGSTVSSINSTVNSINTKVSSLGSLSSGIFPTKFYCNTSSNYFQGVNNTYSTLTSINGRGKLNYFILHTSATSINNLLYSLMTVVIDGVRTEMPVKLHRYRDIEESSVGLEGGWRFDIDVYFNTSFSIELKPAISYTMNYELYVYYSLI